ncbi:hypothetical protein BT69DRAFT_1292102 [Atractiella rhizophila]|nr:hypothetical protein BT69DRAFT_1292102 [Atractiella rhizophila]
MLTIRPPLLRSRLTTCLLLLLALALVVLHITFPFSPSYQATLEAHGVVGAVGRASDKGRKLLGDGWRKAMEYEPRRCGKKARIPQQRMTDGPIHSRFPAGNQSPTASRVSFRPLA